MITSRMKLKAKIFPSNEVCMHGAELRRLRITAGFSERQLADKLGWYRKRIQRLENTHHFCLHPAEMEKLLDMLNIE